MITSKLKQGLPEEQHEGHNEGSEVIVLTDGALFFLVKSYVSKQLQTQKKNSAFANPNR